MAKIDIIVPVYNTEKYIRQCIYSIQSQSFSDFRLILVDDGSTDNCSVICDELAQNDKRIEVIHQRNVGLSAARNAGLKISSNPYICFIDSDDMIHMDYLKHMYELITKCDAELVVCDYHIFGDNEPMGELSGAFGDQDIKVYTDISEYADSINDNAIKMVCVWNKLYKAELLHNIYFPEGKVYEDDYVYYKILDRSKKTVFTDAKLYEYRIQSGSISHEKYSLKMLNHIEAKGKQIQYFHKMKKQRLIEISFDAYMYWIWWNIENMKKEGMPYREIMKPYFSFLRKAVMYLRLTKTFPVKKVLKYWYLAYIKQI